MSVPQSHNHYILDAKTSNRLTKAISKRDGNLICEIVERIDGVQLAYFLSTSKYAHRKVLIETVNEKLPPEMLIHVVPDIRYEAIKILGIGIIVEIISDLHSESVVAMIEDLDHPIKDEIINLLPLDVKREVNDLLSYPEDSAGRLIHKDIVMVPDYWKISQLLDFLHDYEAKRARKFYQIFVVTPKLEPVGVLSLDSVLCAKKEELVKDIMQTDVKIIRPGADQKEVAEMFHRYSLITAPVVNRDGRIIGAITVDDIMNVVYQEGEQDILHLGRVSETDISASLWQTVRKRFPWLVVNLFTATMTSLVIGLFGDTLHHFVELSIVMPVIASMGGNAGLQALTITIRALATKQLSNRNASRLLVKESLVGFGNGMIIALLSFVMLMVRFRELELAILFSVSVIITFTLSTFNGAAVPMLLKHYGVDPAISSSIIICAASDALSFAIFLGFATIFLIG